MLTRKECIDAAEALAHGNDIERRNAARSLADYCRVILNEIGSHYPGYGIVKYISIRHRHRLLRAAVPELLTFEKLFDGIQQYRDKVEHDDEEIPTSEELDNLVKNVKNLDQIFNEKIYPNLKILDSSPYEKLLEDWNAVIYLYDSLDDFPSASMKGLDEVVNQVNHYYSIAPGFKQLSEKTINDFRLELRELQFELKKLLDHGRGLLILKNDQI